jgi:hypothetical protein
VIGELDRDIVVAEQGDEPVELGRRRIDSPLDERLPDRTLATAGQDLPVPACLIGELGEVIKRPALLVPPQLRHGNGAGQGVIALHPSSQHQEVAAFWIGDPVLRCGQSQ